MLRLILEHINGKYGSMSYNILENKYDTLFEGILFIQKRFPYYDKDRLEDNYSNMKYSVQMIEKSLLEDYYFDIKKIYKTLEIHTAQELRDIIEAYQIKI